MNTVSINKNNNKSFKPINQFSYLVRDNSHFVLISLMIFSYFYNLPVLFYSAKGDNELRLYDLLGVFVFYIFIQNFKFYYIVIKKIDVFKWLYYFVLWCSFSIILTFLFSVFNDKLSSFFQSVLYLYHLWVFFITSILFYVISFNKNRLKLFVYLLLIFSTLSCLVIVLQNFSIIPFLWSDIYYKGYAGFLSGTLGPNKIVTGMFSLIMSIFAIGLVFNKKIEINKVFVILVIFINLYVLLLSGSRTSYVGLLVFIVFFSFYKTGGFVFFSISIGSFFAFFIMSNPGLYEKMNDVISNRVINKIEDDQDIENANVGKLYEDLGAGRGRLSMNYINYLGNYPEVIPFGMGFNNRITKGFSAHNMYLNIIKELGLVGFVLYFGWLLKYLQISFKNYSGYALALKGLILSMLVALFFGEHLYIYRPLFAILGLFLIVVNALISSLHNNES
jgi:hypothetical protein